MNPAFQEASPFREASSPFEEAGAKVLSDAAESLNHQADNAFQHRNSTWIRSTQSQAARLATMAGSFVKQALVIALAKFVLEFCALVINYTMDALRKRGKGRVDFTTPNVAYSSSGTPQAGSAPSGDYRNPFASAFQGASVGLF